MEHAPAPAPPPAPPKTYLKWGSPHWTYWFIVFGTITFLLLRRIILWFAHRQLERERCSSYRATQSPSYSWRNAAYALKAFETKYVNRPAIFRVAGVNLFGCLEWGEVLITMIIYLANAVGILVRLCEGPAGTITGTRADQLSLLAAYHIIIQFPIIFATAGRCSLLASVLGTPYRSLNFVHRCLGRLCFVLAIIHCVCSILTLKIMVGPQHVWYKIGHSNLRYAVGALCCIVITTMITLPWVRSRQFNLFLVVHVCAAAIVIPMIYHHRPITARWLWTSVLLWGFDRVRRLTALFHNHVLAPLFTSSRVGTLNASLDRLGGTMILRVPMSFTWQPGQHIYLSFWSWKMLSKPWLFGRWHPFTLTNLPTDIVISEKATNGASNNNQGWMGCCVIQVRQGTTKWLEQCAGPNIGVLVDGPYGTEADFSYAYSTLVLVAGGAGITYVLGVLEGLVISARRGRGGESRHIEVYWVTRNQAAIPWVEHRMNDIGVALRSLNFSISVSGYITSRSQISISSARPRDLRRPSHPPLSFNGHTDEIDLKSITKGIGSPSISSSSLVELGKPPPLTLMHGRPNFPELFSDICSRAHGNVEMHVCGPRSLSDTVKLEAGKLCSPLDTWRGKPGRCITIREELFNTV